MLIEQGIEFELRGPGTLAIGVVRMPGDLASIKMLFMTKLWQKANYFFSFNFF